MADQKPSGLRPPSKIGRPCSNLPPRPAVPPSPPRPSMNQMDHLWETHGRRLSEAGLRRGSDTSVVLTEDTDSFIIGDRVWVGGTKPGSIAYIGETQFAPGDWAGVVLDEPIGKNDGSVAGCRYFQCEPKRGIFSRLTRLTRQPLADFGMMSPTQKTPTTPPDSMRGSLAKSMSPSLNASTTSLSSTVSQRDLRIGERVIVSSTQGSKAGVLRYLGVTEFAPGEWCGVELDEPVGKNDGSVGDKRYFECRPKYGLFAPAHKVIRSPSSRRSMCMVHKPTGAALNSSLKKTGSRESLVSLSSIASTASTAARTGISTARRPGLRTSTLARNTLQESLKERQQEIEFLRRERDLERERFTKAASQADQAEQSIISIKQEYEQYREKMQKTVTEAETALTKLIEEKNALALQLEEEKRKCEDLLFRFEEESVNKDDIQKERTEQCVINTVNENRIRDLERQLLEERERVAQLERDSIKLFETEEELSRLRNEVSNATSQEKHHLEDLQNQNRSLEETKASLEREVHEKSALVEQCVVQIKELESKLNENQMETSTHKESESNLRTELNRVTKALEERSMLIENMKKEFESTADTLKAELQRAKDTIENTKLENINEKESLVSKYEKIVEEKENLMKVKALELATESKKQLEVQSIALEDLKTENVKEIKKLSESFNDQLNMRDLRIKEITIQLDQKTSETEKLMSELSAQIDFGKMKDEELNVALQRLEELNEKLKLMEEKNATLSKQMQEYQSKADDSIKIVQEKQKLEQDVASLIATEANSSAQLKKLSEELKVKEKELSELRSTTAAEIEELIKRYQGQIEEKSKYIEEVTADVSQKSELLSKLEKDIIVLKSILATKDEEIKNLTEKTSELQDALTLSVQTKTNLENELRAVGNNVEKLNQQVASAENKISQITTQKEKLESDIANLVSSSANSSEQLVKYNEDLRLKEKELDELKDKAFTSESTIKSLEGKLSNMEVELSKAGTLIQDQRTALDDSKSQLEKERKLNIELRDKVKQFEIENGELKKIINENERVKENLLEKSEETLNLANELKNSQEKIINLEKQCNSLQNSHNEEMSSLQKQIDESRAELAASQEETKTLQKMKSKLEADQSAHRWSIEELTEKLTAEVENRSKLESLILEKDSSFQEIQSKYLELQKTNEALIVNKETADKNLATSLDAMSNEVKQLKDKLVDATETIKIKEDALIQMTKSTEQTEAEISKLNDTIASMKEQQAHSTEEIQKIQEALSRKEKEVSDITEAKNSLENNVKTLETQLKNVTEESIKKSNSLQEMEHTIKELQNSKNESLTKLQNMLESEIKSKQMKYEKAILENDELEKKQHSLQGLIDKQIHDLSNKETVINKLTAQLKAAQLKEAQSNLEKETKWTERTNELNLTRENMKNNYDAAGDVIEQHRVDKDIDVLKLKEENETAKSQIDFLNSVIVDMQRKNQALMCKVEVLEMGVPANEADDYTQNTLDKRMHTQRMFCDICDQFDLHETEDCPRQAQDFLETEKVAKSPKKVSVERPYCEHCEMFGHDTRDCDDAETF